MFEKSFLHFQENTIRCNVTSDENIIPTNRAVALACVVLNDPEYLAKLSGLNLFLYLIGEIFLT